MPYILRATPEHHGGPGVPLPVLVFDDGETQVWVNESIVPPDKVKIFDRVEDARASADRIFEPSDIIPVRVTLDSVSRKPTEVVRESVLERRTGRLDGHLMPS